MKLGVDLQEERSLKAVKDSRIYNHAGCCKKMKEATRRTAAQLLLSVAILAKSSLLLLSYD